MKREGSRVWIEDVPDMQVGERWDMLLRGLQILLKHRGEDISLDELMVYSGDAFNMCFPSYWQECGYLCVPTDTLSNVTRAYGYTGEWLISPSSGVMRKLDKQSRLDITQKVLDRIWSEIDAGRPVIAGGAADRGCGPWSVITGYDRESTSMSHIGIGEPNRWSKIRGLIIRLGPGDEAAGFWNGRVRGTVQPGFVGGWQNNPAFILGEKTSAPSETERVLQTLQLAVDIHKAKAQRVIYWGGIMYYFGTEAYEEWAKALNELDYAADKAKPRCRESFGWYDLNCMDVLVDSIVRGRTAAAAFLDKAALLFPEAQDSLKAAAELYRDEVGIADASFNAFMPAYVGSSYDRVSYLSTKTRKDDGINAINKMLQKERAAVKEIEKALGTGGKYLGVGS